MTQRDWVAWHDGYDEPGSEFHRRLPVVRQRIREALNRAPAGTIRVLSMCAGQGRDLLGVLPGHPRRGAVRARLVELDPDNAAIARASAPDGVEVVTGDASLAAAYDGIVPVHVALVCGVFGNITDEDIRHLIEELPRLCAPDATVVWTRHRGAPDRTPAVRKWFAGNGFEELNFDGEPGSYGVGAHLLTGPALPYRKGTRLFTFLGH